MSEADKIIKNLKNSGKKVEEFYVSNKTSNINVANIEDVKVLKDLMEELKLEKQTALHNNEYGEYITECDVLDLYDKQILALQHILAELEQKDKRIKELEEENMKLKAQHIFTKKKATDKEKAELYDTIDKTLDTFLEEEKPMWEQEMIADKMKLEEALNIVDAMYQDRYKKIEENNTVYVDRLKDVKFTNLEFASVILLREVQSLQRKLENSIPTQVVLDKIDELGISDEDINIKYVLQELLGGKK